MSQPLSKNKRKRNTNKTTGKQQEQGGGGRSSSSTTSYSSKNQLDAAVSTAQYLLAQDATTGASQRQDKARLEQDKKLKNLKKVSLLVYVCWVR